MLGKLCERYNKDNTLSTKKLLLLKLSARKTRFQHENEKLIKFFTTIVQQKQPAGVFELTNV